jgi:hypothetical protein
MYMYFSCSQETIWQNKHVFYVCRFNTPIDIHRSEYTETNNRANQAVFDRFCEILQGWIKPQSYIVHDNHRPDKDKNRAQREGGLLILQHCIDTSAKLMRDLAQLSNKDLSLVLSLLSASHHTTPVINLFARVSSYLYCHDGYIQTPLETVSYPPCSRRDSTAIF